ncbi:plant intracellular Ras-group-related LRR protein 1-like [Forsythia ovata]|uniref:Plant intracellular Ras-group-related LRR protein 1-like n=1 Tax=Forsythia ovata TaxID=205694 RepID=A0ABD1NTP6_9LAMI
MTVLSSKKILQENNTNDPNSITSLTLTHKALSDVSCLGEFRNLERLDLGFNNLTSLEGLKSCVNLKWLSVLQNKLQSLKGIECLSKLYVLNAGKNKLKSMDEVKSLASLRALILNDNDISSVCKLDQMKELNTLVLSRNPIRTLGDSVIKLKSITKLSLSNCQLQTIDSSLKSCAELKELRLAHNEITTLPSEFVRLVKLQNLDLGNNFITKWSDLKVLSSLVDLKNLNLQGNPVAEKENLVKKVKKLVPNVQIFNGRPIDKIMTKEETDKVDVSSEKRISRKGHLDNAGALGSEKKRKNLFDEKASDCREDGTILEKTMKKKLKVLLQNDSNITDDAETPTATPGDDKKSKHKIQKALDLQGDNIPLEKKPDKKSRKKVKGGNINVIDSSEAPFTDLFTDTTDIGIDTNEKKLDHRTTQDIDAVSGLVTFPTKKKKKRNRSVDPAALQLSPVDEVGLGGPSTWDDL